MGTNVTTHTVKLLYVVHYNLAALKLRSKAEGAHSKEENHRHKQRH